MKQLIQAYVKNEEGMSELVAAIIILGICLVFAGILAVYSNKAVGKTKDAADTIESGTREGSLGGLDVPDWSKN